MCGAGNVSSTYVYMIRVLRGVRHAAPSVSQVIVNQCIVFDALDNGVIPR